MSNKFVLLLIFLITAVFISGCIDGTKTPVELTGKALIPTTGLPPGFTYMGTNNNSDPMDIGGKLFNYTEGVYRKSGDDFEIYIQVIGTENPGALLEQYKSDIMKKFKDQQYNPFEDISLNGHPATKIADFTVKNGPKTVYSITWVTEKSMVIVGESSDSQEVKDLANATGH